MKKNKDSTFRFRWGTVRVPSTKRIDRVRSRSMESFHVLPAYLRLFPYWRTGFTLFKFVYVVIKKFFMIQYLQKIHLTHRPVKHVDHALDQKVPFRPEKIKIYMQFINIWIRPVEMLLKRFGQRDGAKLSREFFRYITLTYNEAYRMYSICLTTTVRPKCPATSAISHIQRADPHYLCVPSLHIAIVCLCYSFYRMLFERENFTQEEKDRWLKELYNHSIQIAETVLYVKQHSVNCIPAALYMMTKITPELTDTQLATDFIEDLFKTADDVSEEDGKKIRAHIQFVYERFLLEGITEDDWTVPVARWLKDYEPCLPEQIVLK